MTSAAGPLLCRHALPLIVLVGAVLRFATLDQGFLIDEHLTLEIGQLGPGELLTWITGESNGPLYYLLAAGWERIFGSAEFGMRSLSALLGTATIPVV